MIAQKELLCINRMNLYLHDIDMGGIFQKQKGSLPVLSDKKADY